MAHAAFFVDRDKYKVSFYDIYPSHPKWSSIGTALSRIADISKQEVEGHCFTVDVLMLIRSIVIQVEISFSTYFEFCSDFNINAVVDS